MEILASLTVCVALTGSVGIATLQGFPVLFAVVICLQSVICLCLENCVVCSKKSHLFNLVRPQCGSGVYCSQLVPVAVIMSTYFFNVQNVTDPYWMRLAVVCTSLTAVSISTHLGYIETLGCNEKGVSVNSKVIMPLATWFLTMVPLFASLASYNVIFAKEDFLVVILTTGITAFLQRTLLRLAPKSFSLGEAALVAHGFVLLFYTSHSFKKAASNETDFLQIAGFCCVLVIVMAVYVDFLQSTLGFYVITMFVVISVATPLSLIILDQHFVLWIIEFVTEHSYRLYLFLFWGTSCVIAIIIVAYYYVCSHPDQSHQSSTTIRKVFHVLAVCVYLPGILVDVKMTYVASTCAIIVFIMLEVIRKLNVWPFGIVLEESFRVFLDSRDAGPIILTHLYLLTGCTVPLWLGVPSTNMDSVHVALFSGILSLGVGDTSASIVGSRFGSNKWPGTNKTMEGTCAAVVLQLITMVILTSTFTVHYTSWIGILIAVLLTSVVEAFTTQIDNIVLPVLMHTLLLSLQ